MTTSAMALARPDQSIRRPVASALHMAVRELAPRHRAPDRIDDFLGHPAVDPHGDPIPRPDGSLTEPLGMPLAQLARGARFRVIRVVEQDPAFLRYLTECGLDLGAEGELDAILHLRAADEAGLPLIEALHAVGL